MTDKESVITHLQIMHVWAEFALERDLDFFTKKHIENITEWTGDALELLKKQEQEKEIKAMSNFCVECVICCTPVPLTEREEAYITNVNHANLVKVCDDCKNAVKYVKKHFKYTVKSETKCIKE